ncbi:MAG: SMP-30/gluconolactonase/LRE family protein [Alphaproteobacteria bacterium]
MAQDVKFECVAGPFESPANGVVWDGESLLFALREEQRLMRLDPASGDVSEARKYTSRTGGLAIGPGGELYGGQEASRRLIEFLPNGSSTAIDALLDGDHHNHPGDLSVDSQGRIWFTDPFSPVLAQGPQFFPPLDHASVLRVARDHRRAWVMQRMTYDTKAPRAVLVSHDEKTLYVAEGEARADHVRELRAYPIGEDGTLGNYHVLHTFGADHRGPQRGIEGMCLDADGNIVACGGWSRNGPGALVYVFSPDGAVLESWRVPVDMPNRCAFGGPELDTLYVTTAAGELFAAETSRRGFVRTA